MEFSGDYNPKEFCWRDLELLTDFFSEENFIGKINFGKVYRGKTQQGQQVTVKIWLHQPDERDCYPSDKDYCFTRLVSEGIFLSDPDVVHHPNLVKLMGCCCEVEYGHFGVVYDLRSKDTLLNLIDKDDLTWTQRVKVALDIARLVEHLHHHKPPYVLHFTHPALIMLDQDYNPVLFDFFNLSGGAVGDKQLSSYSDMFTFSQGYRGYIDVNFLMTGEWSIKSDEYSFAILLLGLISKRAFDGEKWRPKIELNPVQWALIQYKLKLNSGFQLFDCPLVHESLKGEPGFRALDGVAITKLARCCVDLDKGKRPTMSQIVLYLQGLHLFTGNCGSEISDILEEGLLDDWDTEYRLGNPYKEREKKRKDWKGCLKIPCLATKK